ncbi:hypothetical protein SLE2022_307850 [Rubroshorea leprosula]
MTEPHPNGRGMALRIEKALAQSGVARGDVNYINAHAASTQLRINSTKSMTGYSLGASGAVEAITTVKVIRWIQPNINLDNPEEGVDMNLLVGVKKERLDIKVALSNSFGFGGHNSSILLAPFR